MTRDDSKHLWQQGRGAWNNWARALLKRRADLMDQGKWDALSHVDFGGYDFGNEAIDFSGFIFPGMVNFTNAKFSGVTSFNKATFHEIADFYGASFSHHASFVDTLFKETPSFMGVLFTFSPSILNMRVARPSFFNKNYRDKMNDPEKFSVLAKVAAQGNETRLAHHFHGSQLIAQRHITEQWWQVGFWAGMFYQVFSNFGQSLMRPFLSWVGSIFIFAWLYLQYYKVPPIVVEALEPSQLESFWQSTKSWFVSSAETSVFKMQCAADEGGLFMKALYLSVKQAFLNLGGGNTEKLTQVYTCLYGINPNYSKVSPIPFIPDSVAFLGILQMSLSAIFVFFFSLALHKRFSIKT